MVEDRSSPLLLLAVVAGFGVASCASSGEGLGGVYGTTTFSTAAGNYEVETYAAPTQRHSVEGFTADEIFRVLPAVFRELEMPPTFFSQADMATGVERHRVRRNLAGRSLSTFVRCSAGPGRSPEDGTIQFTVVTRVSEDARGYAQVRTELEARPIGTDGTSGRRACASRGALEALVVTMAQLAAAERRVEG